MSHDPIVNLPQPIVNVPVKARPPLQMPPMPPNPHDGRPSLTARTLVGRFPKRVFVKGYIHADHDKEAFFWKCLCVVYDNEALELLKRILSKSELECKVTDA